MYAAAVNSTIPFTSSFFVHQLRSHHIIVCLNIFLLYLLNIMKSLLRLCDFQHLILPEC
jgi:hypothetical protein